MIWRLIGKADPKHEKAEVDRAVRDQAKAAERLKKALEARKQLFGDALLVKSEEHK